MQETVKVMLRTQNEIRFAAQTEIIYCKSDDCYTTVHLSDGENVMISKSLTLFSKELDPETFIRISQSVLVNKSLIKQINKKNKQIELINKVKVPFTVTVHKLLLLINFRLPVFASAFFQTVAMEP